jgi:hypothetical protein
MERKLLIEGVHFVPGRGLTFTAKADEVNVDDTFWYADTKYKVKAIEVASGSKVIGIIAKQC